MTLDVAVTKPHLAEPSWTYQNASLLATVLCCTTPGVALVTSAWTAAWTRVPLLVQLWPQSTLDAAASSSWVLRPYMQPVCCMTHALQVQLQAPISSADHLFVACGLKHNHSGSKVPVSDCISTCIQCCVLSSFLHNPLLCRIWHAFKCRDKGDDAENEAPEAPKGMKRLKKQVDCCR